MTLRDVVNSIDGISDDLVIFATKTDVWQPDDTAALILESDAIEIGTKMEELFYFLEVYIAKEVLEVWSEWRDGKTPSQDESLEAIVFYAENDAYLKEDAGVRNL